MLDFHDTLEEETRALTSMSLRAVFSEEPSISASIGPGVYNGPRRYIGVMRPVQLFLFFQAWCRSEQISRIPSFTTFLRGLYRASPWLRFRKVAGQHANCDTCLFFKQQLKRSVLLTPSQRSHVLEDYLCF
jgi:hypothetical protein